MMLMAAAAPNSDIGIVISGTSAARNEPMSAITTTPTSRTVSISVMKISRSASRIYRVMSKPMVISMPSGRSLLTSSRISYM